MYAGFWKRFVAYIIDKLVLSAVKFLLFLPLAFIFVFFLGPINFNDDYYRFTLASMDYGSVDEIGAFLMVIIIMFFVFLQIIVNWLYFALFESSKHQATLGKLALGIQVTTLEGNRISFGRATGRYFGKILSAMILYIGYIMAGLTMKKQALHDILASCLVINTLYKNQIEELKHEKES